MIVRPSIIIVNDNKILLLKYDYNGHLVFALPGGNPDNGETLRETLIRELREELGIDIEIYRLAITGEVLIPGKRPVLHCVFLAGITGGTPQLDSRHTTALALEWQEANELPSLNLYPNVGQEISDLLSGKMAAANPYIGKIKQQWFET